MKERVRRLKELLKDPFRIEEFLKEIQELEKEIQNADKETLIEMLQEYKEVKELFLRNYEMLRGFWEVKGYVRT